MLAGDAAVGLTYRASEAVLRRTINDGNTVTSMKSHGAAALFELELGVLTDSFKDKDIQSAPLCFRLLWIEFCFWASICDVRIVPWSFPSPSVSGVR